MLVLLTNYRFWFLLLLCNQGFINKLLHVDARFYEHVFSPSIPYKIVSSQDDQKHMFRALELASKALGNTRPNPCVGCVIVDNSGIVVGEGFHRRAGTAHAEVEALLQAGNLAYDGTAYVSLEPCNHYGRTPPCTQALLKAGIRRVVSGTVDPDPRVSGRGLMHLHDQGISITHGIEEEACMHLNAPFIYRVLQNRPFLISWHHSHSSISYASEFQSRVVDIVSYHAREVDMIWLHSDTLSTLLDDDPRQFKRFIYSLPRHIDIMILDTSSSSHDHDLDDSQDMRHRVDIMQHIINEHNLVDDTSIEPWKLKRKLYYASKQGCECLSDPASKHDMMMVDVDMKNISMLFDYCRRCGSNAILYNVDDDNIMVADEMAQKIIMTSDSNDEVKTELRWKPTARIFPSVR